MEQEHVAAPQLDIAARPLESWRISVETRRPNWSVWGNEEGQEKKKDEENHDGGGGLGRGADAAAEMADSPSDKRNLFQKRLLAGNANNSDVNSNWCNDNNRNNDSSSLNGSTSVCSNQDGSKNNDRLDHRAKNYRNSNTSDSGSSIDRTSNGSSK